MTITTLSSGTARLSFDPARGGMLSAGIDGATVLAAAPALSLVVDGASITGWNDASVSLGDAGMLSIDGVVGEGLRARLTITAPGNGAAFDFAFVVENTGDVPRRLSRVDAFAAIAVPGDWQGLSYASKWGEEYEPQPFAVDGPRTIECRSGRSSLGHTPWLGLEDGEAAIVLAPAWSGNWHIQIAPEADGIHLAAGISPWKFWVDLQPGESFAAPSVMVAFGRDLEEASLALTRATGALLPRSVASDALPLEWNHWWPYEDKDISADVFLDNAAIAAELGFAVSTLDAGWFGAADAETFWWDIRGDFSRENLARFPGGIAALADDTRARGQKFGIWMEIEAVGLKAEIRTGRPELMARRNDDPPEAPLDPADPGFLGYICLGSAEGRAHVTALLDDLVGKTRCEWIKVDFNLDPKAGCSCTDHGHGEGDGLYAHYRGLYALFDAFRAAHPAVVLEACASGGLRIDAGIARHVHCLFLSDPDWMAHHLAVVHGTSRLLPPAAMLHWPMSEWRGTHERQTLRLSDRGLTEDVFDALVRSAFLHRFGLSWRLPDLPRPLRERLAGHLAIYRETVVPFVRDGDLRRLTPPPLRSGAGEQQPAFQLSSGDRHLLLGFSLGPVTENLGIRATASGFTITPRGLDPLRRYRLVLLGPGEHGEGVERTGADWMVEGLPPVRGASFAGLLEPQ